MPPGTNPLRLQVIDRFEVVLKAIVTGDDYFYTPAQVAKRLLPFEEVDAKPAYMIFGDSGGNIETYSNHQYDEVFNISVKGIVCDIDDPVSKVEKCIRDVRKALNVDSLNGAAGSLRNLTVQIRINVPPEIDFFEDFGFFDQLFMIQITGDFGEL